jgi:hypothetical protein
MQKYETLYIQSLMLVARYLQLHWPLRVSVLVASKPLYGEVGEAITHEASCFLLCLSNFRIPRTDT